MQTNWFAVFSVKVTAGAYTIQVGPSCKQLVCLQSNWVWYYSVIYQSGLWTFGITALKVKAAAKVQTAGECVRGWYLLNRRTLCYQTWYGDAAP